MPRGKQERRKCTCTTILFFYVAFGFNIGFCERERCERDWEDGMREGKGGAFFKFKMMDLFKLLFLLFFMDFCFKAWGGQPAHYGKF
jgi:hypothetical protein